MVLFSSPLHTKRSEENCKNSVYMVWESNIENMPNRRSVLFNWKVLCSFRVPDLYTR